MEDKNKIIKFNEFFSEDDKNNIEKDIKKTKPSDTQLFIEHMSKIAAEHELINSYIAAGKEIPKELRKNFAKIEPIHL